MTPMPNRFASLPIAAALAGLVALAWPGNASAGGDVTEVESEGQAFTECGTLHVSAGPGGITCASLEIHVGGVYQLDQYGGFSDGAEVCVTGTLTGCGSSCGSTVPGCVAVTAIQLESQGGGIDGTAVSIEECGMVLEASSACFVFQADGGELYVVGLPVGGYDEGDRMHLSGDLVTCTSACEPADGCVINPEVSSCPLAGDLSGDGHVNGLDLALLLGAWGPCTGCAADLDGNGTVNGLDLAILLGSWS